MNSFLMRFFTTVFGLSHLSVRAPALIGAALFVGMAYKLCRLITEEIVLGATMFVCLVYNPFILDYLVAARGYGLATALMLGAIAVFASSIRTLRNEPTPGLRLSARCASASMFLGLTFAANFAFAFVACAIALTLLVWSWFIGKAPRTNSLCLGLRATKLIAVWTIPAVSVNLFLTSYTLIHWPKGQLWYGASSVSETVQSLLEASFYRLNPFILNPLLLPLVKPLRFAVVPAAVSLVLCQMVLFHRRRRSSPDQDWRARFGAALLVVLSLTATMQLIAFAKYHLLLPLERTGIYYVPLVVLWVGSIAAVPVDSPAGRWVRRGLVSVLLACAFYFVCSLRLTYFRQWEWDADVRSAYDVVAYYNRQYGVRRVPASWHYVAALNFYREMSGRESIEEFRTATPYPTDCSVYVLLVSFDYEFIATNGLKAVYRGDVSDLVVAIRPEIEQRRNRGDP
jgi:hypothetical protein